MPRLAALLVAAALVLAAAPSAHALAPGQLFGMGDQDDVAMFDDPRFQALEVGAARLVVSWDVATSRAKAGEAEKVDRWVAAARAAGARPLLAFGGLRRVAPSDAAYTRAVRAAVARWAGAEFQAWNEASHPSQPATFRNPERAGRFARILDRACANRCVAVPVCIVIGQTPEYDLRWTRRFVAAYGRTPKRWGLHTYGPANRRSTKDLARFLRTFPKGQVWITESASWFSFSTPWPASSSRQAARVKDVFAPARTYPTRVKRLYWYEWRAPDDPEARWDSGLLARDGSSRPAYAAVLRERFRR
jgi:hypothetical protein